MGFGRLVAMSSSMLVATLIASFTPLYLNLKPRTIATVSIYSTGLLLGAALTVVIPEGISAVYENTTAKEDHDGHAGEHDHSSHDNSQWIGLALVAGFILMYIIDSLHSHEPPHHHTVPSRGVPIRTSSSDSELAPLSSRDPILQSNRSGFDWEESGGRPSASPTSTSARSTSYYSQQSEAPSSAFSTVVGLLVHSIADGISLGASSVTSSSAPSTKTTDDTSLDLIIFLAIMVHKAPAAFALSTLLSSTPGVSAWYRHQSLLAFSLAAPFGAVLTYVGLNVVGAEGGSNVGWWTGVALVFSGGTFLFVATHVMKDKEGSSESSEGEETPGTVSDKRKMVLVLGGMVTPLLLSRLVGHGH